MPARFYSPAISTLVPIPFGVGNKAHLGLRVLDLELLVIAKKRPPALLDA
jgi:hypothetical protein